MMVVVVVVVVVVVTVPNMLMVLMVLMVVHSKLTLARISRPTGATAAVGVKIGWLHRPFSASGKTDSATRAAAAPLVSPQLKAVGAAGGAAATGLLRPPCRRTGPSRQTACLTRW